MLNDTLPRDPPVLTVSELTNAIKNKLETTFPSIWIQGEVSNCKLHSSGHLYFSLKDQDAQIAAVMFRGNAATLRVPPKDGDSVIAYGCLNVYPTTGKYQIVIQELRHAGLGELLLKLEELKRKLNKRGWFNKARKRPLPPFPKRIGLITSATGAAIQDILNILTRRFYGFHLILNPVRVQGEGAAAEISQAIKQFNEHDLVDVLIVGRGGGSFEDLWAFNEEIVAEAIFNSHIPIIAAVGHETDHCIAEYVADVRAPTPSAAAELVIADRAQHLQHLGHIQRRLFQTIFHILKQNRQRLEGIIKQPILRSPYPLLSSKIQNLDGVKQLLDSSMRQHCKNINMQLEARRKLLQSLKPTSQILNFQQKFSSLRKRLEQYWQRNLTRKRERVQNITTSLQQIDPKNLLTKGYSILFSEKDELVIKSVLDLKKDMRLKVLLSDGKANVKVKDIIRDHEPTD
ncbi:MAG TPA: exodeoxyribonuclease VII large subunit [Waddliaceae bacterium]